MHNNHIADTDILQDSFVILDIETTGVNCKEDNIIEISAIRYDNFKETSVFSTLVNPQTPLPDVITRLTGIMPIELEAAPVWEHIQDDFLHFIGNFPLVGHNICGFDIRFIEKAIGFKITAPIIDTLDLARRAFPNLPNHRLAYLNSALGIGSQNSHRALDDVRTTFALLKKCLHELSHEGSVLINSCICEDQLKQDRPSSKKYKDSVDIKSIKPTCADANAASPLWGKNIVFTGTLSMPREEAMQIAVNAGAILKTSVSRKTNYLVIGAQDNNIVGEDGLSSKEERAQELNQSGNANIKMITEEEFLALVAQQDQSESLEQESCFASDIGEDGVYDILKTSLLETVQKNNVLPEKLMLKTGKAYASVFYDTQMAFRICCRVNHHYFGVSNIYSDLVPSTLTQHITKDGRSDGFTNFVFDTSHNGILQFADFLSAVLDSAIDSLPKEFDCCSYYEQCSDAKRCINPNSRIATGCGYRRIMKKGRIFYGKNRNVD